MGNFKLERRGKYGGVKVHLDPDHCINLAKWVEKNDKAQLAHFCMKVGQDVVALMEKDPTLLKPRSPEEIQAELKEEQVKATMKLAKAGCGLDWNGKGEEKDHYVVILRPTGKIQTFFKKSFAEWEDWAEFMQDAPLHEPMIVRAT